MTGLSGPDPTWNSGGGWGLKKPALEGKTRP
jgi:hypothetical protein